MGTNHISGTAEARVIKFWTPVGYIKSQNTEDESPLKGALSGSRDPFFNFNTCNHISKTTKATVPNGSNGCGQSHMTRFFQFCPDHIFGIGEAKLHISNFVCWLIHRSTSVCMIYYPQTGCVMCHVTSLNFEKQVIISR